MTEPDQDPYIGDYDADRHAIYFDGRWIPYDEAMNMKFRIELGPDVYPEEWFGSSGQ